MMYIMAIPYLIILLECVLFSHGSPYTEFLSRVEEYKERALGGVGCGWWENILRLHYQHSNYCEEGLLTHSVSVDDFEMAGVAWIMVMEWDNPLLTDRVRNTLLSRLTSMPLWLDEAGKKISWCNPLAPF